jgi:ferredoxin
MLMFASVASANTFRAADIVYLPAVARAPGVAGAFFKTDVTIVNTSTSRVVVKVAYVEGSGDNSTAPNTLITLPTFVPGERRELIDIAQSALDRETANGYLIFFSCREGGNCTNCDSNAADCLNIAVQGRIYNDTPAGTFGQSFPGLPWYSYAAFTSTAQGTDRLSINGVRNNADYRTNIGLVNASQFSSTVLRLRVFNNTGTQVGEMNQTLGPLGRIQLPVTQIAAGFTGNGYVTVEQVSATPTPAEADAVPGFFAYGSLLDNRTNDPTTLEAQFSAPLPSDCANGSMAQRRMIRREAPSDR